MTNLGPAYLQDGPASLELFLPKPIKSLSSLLQRPLFLRGLLTEPLVLTAGFKL
jgi:hypothetical protein